MFELYIFACLASDGSQGSCSTGMRRMTPVDVVDGGGTTTKAKLSITAYFVTLLTLVLTEKN